MASAQEKALPRFEFGLAAAALTVPAYPSSSVSSERGFALPWFIYRSDRLQVKEGGISLIAFQNDRLTIDLGIGGALNSDTSDTPLREGLPDLDFVLELGPRFNVSLLNRLSDTGRTRVNWETSYRFAVSTDFGSLDFQGPVLNTIVRLRRDELRNEKLSYSLSLGSTWWGNQLSDYVFAVAPEFATPTRPAFDANSGFLGLNIFAGIDYDPLPNLSTFLGLGLVSHAGSENRDSPLFEDEVNTSVIFGVSWTIFQSKRLVRTLDE